MGQLLSFFWKTEDVQRPSLSDMPYPVLKRIFQYACSNEGTAALQYRLVSHTINDATLMNIRLYLNYKITSEPNRCQISLAQRRHWMNTYFSTDQLVNSRLVERIFGVTIRKEVITDNWDQQDLINLVSEFSRPVDVSLHSMSYAPLPVLPMAVRSQMRVVKIAKSGNDDLTVPELSLIAREPHLRHLEMSSKILLQLNRFVDTSKISQLKINWDLAGLDRESPANWDLVSKRYSQVTKLVIYSSTRQADLKFIDNFRHLQTLRITDFCRFDPVDFLHIDLPHLVECQIHLGLGKDVSPDYFFTLVTSAMPNLKKLTCYLQVRYDDFPDAVVHRIQRTAVASVIQFCPGTVEELHLAVYGGGYERSSTQRFRFSRSKWHRHLTTLFTAVLNSRLTRVSVKTWLNPIDYDLNANPFQFKKSRNGVQVGDAVTTIKFSPYSGLRQHPVHEYVLKKRNGQICTLDIIYLAQR